MLDAVQHLKMQYHKIENIETVSTRLHPEMPDHEKLTCFPCFTLNIVKIQLWIKLQILTGKDSKC